MCTVSVIADAVDSWPHYRGLGLKAFVFMLIIIVKLAFVSTDSLHRLLRDTIFDLRHNKVLFLSLPLGYIAAYAQWLFLVANTLVKFGEFGIKAK